MVLVAGHVFHGIHDQPLRPFPPPQSPPPAIPNTLSPQTFQMRIVSKSIPNNSTVEEGGGGGGRSLCRQ